MYLLSSFVLRNINLLALPLFATLAFIFLSAPSKYNEEEGIECSNCSIVLYRYYGILDVYSDGDIYGKEITVKEYKHYEIRNLIYREEDGQKSIQDTTVQNGSLKEAKFDTLAAKIKALNASSLPQRLPDVSPQRLQGPAEEIVLKARRTSSEEFKTIRAHMGASAEHYSADFLQLHRFLKQLIRQKVSESPG
jgi:hypothetical protein